MGIRPQEGMATIRTADDGTDDIRRGDDRSRLAARLGCHCPGPSGAHGDGPDLTERALSWPPTRCSGAAGWQIAVHERRYQIWQGQRSLTDLPYNFLVQGTLAPAAPSCCSVSRTPIARLLRIGIIDSWVAAPCVSVLGRELVNVVDVVNLSTVPEGRRDRDTDLPIRSVTPAPTRILHARPKGYPIRAHKGGCAPLIPRGRNHQQLARPHRDRSHGGEG
jgi:hypothetical protein